MNKHRPRLLGPACMRDPAVIQAGVQFVLDQPIRCTAFEMANDLCGPAIMSADHEVEVGRHDRQGQDRIARLTGDSLKSAGYRACLFTIEPHGWVLELGLGRLAFRRIMGLACDAACYAGLGGSPAKRVEIVIADIGGSGPSRVVGQPESVCRDHGMKGEHVTTPVERYTSVRLAGGLVPPIDWFTTLDFKQLQSNQRRDKPAG